jgi:hypothetical protein
MGELGKLWAEIVVVCLKEMLMETLKKTAKMLSY